MNSMLWTPVRSAIEESAFIKQNLTIEERQLWMHTCAHQAYLCCCAEDRRASCRTSARESWRPERQVEERAYVEGQV
jgi:hypothetical protein